MPQALTRIAPNLLPVPYNRAEALAAARQYAQQQLTADRSEPFRVEPPRTEVRYARVGDFPNAAPNGAAFATQQLGESARSLLTQRQPLAGYGAYATTAQQTDPERSRPGQTLDLSV